MRICIKFRGSFIEAPNFQVFADWNLYVCSNKIQVGKTSRQAVMKNLLIFISFFKRGPKYVILSKVWLNKKDSTSIRKIALCIEARPGILNISLAVKFGLNVPTMTLVLLAISSNFQILNIFGFWFWNC